MLDDFRQQANEASFEDELEVPEQRSSFLSRFSLPDGKFLGLTAQQRFIVAFLLLLLVVLGGVAGLLIAGKVVPVF